MEVDTILALALGSLLLLWVAMFTYHTLVKDIVGWFKEKGE